MLSIVMSPHLVFLPAIVVSKHEHFCLYIDSVVFYCSLKLERILDFDQQNIVTYMS